MDQYALSAEGLTRWQCSRRLRPNVVLHFGVPTMFIAELDREFSRFDLSSLRTKAGAPCPVVMKRVKSS